jgi:hypothetical protein
MNRGEWTLLAVGAGVLGAGLATVRAMHLVGLLFVGMALGVLVSVIGTLAHDALTRRGRPPTGTS